MKKYIIGFFGLLAAHASAFTFDFAFDFVAYNGSTINSSTPLTVNVPGYGNVIFSTTGANTFTVNSTYTAPSSNISLAILPTRSLTIEFAGANPLVDINDVSFGFNNLSGGDGLTYSVVNASTITLNMGSGGNGAGLRDVSFSTVPEPSTAILGATGLFALALRRRRIA